MARNRPSGENASTWPVNVRRGQPVANSQSWACLTASVALPNETALARNRPSGEKASACTAAGWAFVILDGKVVDSDRCAAKTTSRKGDGIDLWYSGKRGDFGGNIQAVMRPDGSSACAGSPSSV